MVKKLLFFLGLLSGFIVILIIICIALLHIFFTPERTKFLIISQLSASLHQQVSIDNVDLNILKGEIILNDIEVFKKQKHGIDKRIIVEIKKILLQFDILSPIRGDIVIKQIDLVKPQINISQLPEFSVSNLVFRKKMFSFVNTTISRFFIDRGEICYVINKNKLLKIDNIRAVAEDISVRNPFNLKLFSDINLYNKNFDFSLNADFNLVEKTIELKETELSSQNSIFELTGKIYDFIEEPYLDLKIKTKKSVLVDLKEIIDLPYPITLIPKNGNVNLELEGNLNNLNIKILN